jgi:hypothetical protein
MMLDASTTTIFDRYFLFRAFSAPKIHGPLPRALPWAITFRAFGAGAFSLQMTSNFFSH